MRTLRHAVRRATGVAQQLVLVAAPHGGQRRARVNALTSLSAGKLTATSSQPHVPAYVALSG